MPQQPLLGHVRLLTVIKLAALIALVVAANYVAHWFVDVINFEIRPSNEDAVHRTIMLSALAYIILLAIPFVPGVEIAVSLIVLLGPSIVWLVYLCTLAGLCLGYCIGRMIPLNGLIGILDTLHLSRASGLLRKIAPMSGDERLTFLLNAAPNRYVPILLKHRYLALALAINLPGNLLIGGGGGIAMIAGISRLFSFPGFVLTTTLAVLPVPLAVHLFGTKILAG